LGIVADDIVAGIYSNFILRLGWYFSSDIVIFNYFHN